MKGDPAEIAEMKERISTELADCERLHAEYVQWLADWCRLNGIPLVREVEAAE